MRGKNKGGQITIFVILGILIIAFAFLIYYFYPQIVRILPGQSINPSSYLQGCVEEDLNEAIEKVSLQGGSVDPQHYLLYEGKRLEYLCYTNEYYKTCVMQQPMLKNHIEKEIEDAIFTKSGMCLTSLEESYKKNGYEVQLRKGKISVELLPKRVVVDFNSTMVLKKEGTQIYDSLTTSVTNNLYELISIAMSILNFEARYGDSETTIYMNYYHDLKVEKIKQTEGSKAYILTDRNNGNKFQFATRSLAWPPAV